MIDKLTSVCSLSLSHAEGGEQPRVRRASSLPNVNDEELSAITLEDIQNVLGKNEPQSSTLRRQEDLRKSSRRLKERIQIQYVS